MYKFFKQRTVKTIRDFKKQKAETRKQRAEGRKQAPEFDAEENG
jgi:hypothetical protein